ncbi:MAG: cysteine hydrolase family protein [Clostridium sp.]
MGKALMVVDMQNVCVGENHAKFFKYNRKELISSVNNRIAEYENNNVIYIINIMKDNFINKLAPFKCFEGSEEAKIAKSVDVVSNNIFKKYVGNSFANKELDIYLKKNNIAELEIVGVDGGGCVASTALGAIEKGYKVTLNKACIGTMFIKNAKKLNRKLENQGAIFI